MHCKGSRHCKAESKLKERELVRQDEINKRIAFSDCSTATSNSIKPLVEHTRKATSDILPNITCQQSSESSNCDLELAREHALNVAASSMRNSSFPQTVASEKVVTERVLDFRERREIELKFIAAGWKRDCNGKWYKDENVSFFSGLTIETLERMPAVFLQPVLVIKYELKFDFQIEAALLGGWNFL